MTRVTPSSSATRNSVHRSRPAESPAARTPADRIRDVPKPRVPHPPSWRPRSQVPHRPARRDHQPPSFAATVANAFRRRFDRGSGHHSGAAVGRRPSSRLASEIVGCRRRARSRRARHRAGALRADAERAVGLDPDDRAAAGADGVDIQLRHLQRERRQSGCRGTCVAPGRGPAPRRCWCRPCRR